MLKDVAVQSLISIYFSKDFSFYIILIYILIEEGQIRTDAKRFGDACSATKLLLHLYSSKHNTIAATNTKSKTNPVNNTGNAAS